MSRDLSLMPEGQKNAGATLPSRPTLRIILICAAVIALGLFFRWQTGSQLSAEQTSLKEAQSQQQQLELRSQSMKKQLGELQTAGGASRIDLVKGLAKARVDWKKVILAVARDSSPGIVISAFSGTAPVAPGADEEASADATQSDIQLTGQAASRDQLQAFVKRLRANKKVFLDVQLKKASADESQAPTDPEAEAPKSEAVSWDIGLRLPPLPPMPANGSASGEGQ